jgi:hypothetical protein
LIVETDKRKEGVPKEEETGDGLRKQHVERAAADLVVSRVPYLAKNITTRRSIPVHIGRNLRMSYL